MKVILKYITCTNLILYYYVYILKLKNGLFFQQ
jgi:hypothetical protein